ncbi:PREDICTED: beta-fructofuranosidase, insoluble isoenzyme CWINV1-like [Tarenaya hassleriana]|uniref:beta-fructofuranosidase, insoluble isoenzyme CWINV1-like n=1 Tax=Tarenaya hassleriana TaxID=28532 RepID=UPI00053C7418|nr:PREDICTED: beta-fructofuranosidase, insoluble isoenzyme CWINV1-like [Tarenaya hassleriana]
MAKDIGLVVLLSLLLLGNYVVNLEASHHHHHVYKRFQSSKAKSPPPNQPYRTGYHFQPPKNWMNDPNGPMLYKGIYHLFYQYNPNGAVWGNIVWGHSTSTDLVNWVPHPPAISPSEPYDAGGCWSGSVTILLDGKPVILYTGVHGTDNIQTQNLAEPTNLSDPFLRQWSKSPANPLMAPTAANSINATSFRDPTTAWLSLDGKWRVIIGSKIDRRGLAILYTSKDFVNWTESPEPLHSDDGTGMWECPDFYPVARFGSLGVETSSFGGPPLIKHVLKMSLDDTKHDYYTIGTYDRVKDVYVPDKGFAQNGSAPRYDYGKYYASKTFYDPLKNRRVLWGWVNESSPVVNDVEKGWSGLQAIPRKIWLDRSGKQLIQWPIKEIEKLRATQVKWPYKVLEAESVLEVSGITASQADVEVSFKVRGLEKADEIEPDWTDAQLICSEQNESVKAGLGPFGLMVLASKSLEEYTSVYFRIFKAHNDSNKYVVVMCSDQSRSSLEQEDNDRTTYGAFVDIDPFLQPLSLRTLIDHSIVESFGGRGEACITARIYPKLAIGEEAHLYVFNNGRQSVHLSSLSAWTMATAHIN